MCSISNKVKIHTLGCKFNDALASEQITSGLTLNSITDSFYINCIHLDIVA